MSKSEKRTVVYIGIPLFCITFLCIVLQFGFTDSHVSVKPKVENYSDNSQYHQILAKNFFKDYIKKQCKDPDSFQEVSYSSVYNSARGCYVVDLKYRARNSFGGMVVERVMGDVKFQGNNVSFSNISRIE